MFYINLLIRSIYGLKSKSLDNDSIKLLKIGNTTSYVFAVKQTSARSTAFQNLTIEETEKGTKAFVTTYFPSKKWISDYRSGIKSTFDGKLVFTRINISGQPDKNAQQAKEMERLSSLNPAKSSVVSLICETYTVYEYTAVPCSGLLGHMPGEDCPFYDDPTQGTPPSYAFVPVEYEDCYEYNSDDPGGNTTPTIPDPYDPCGGGPIASFIPFEKGTRLATVPPSDCDGNGGGGVEEPPSEPIEPLPCENVPEQNLLDTINVVNPILREALKKMLPMSYYQYIEFDNAGNLNKTKFLGAEQNSLLQNSEIYDALAYMIRSDVDITLYSAPDWRGLMPQYPNNPDKKYTFEMAGQFIDGITVLPITDPLTNIPVTGNASQGNIYVNNYKKSSVERLAYLCAHELIGHMYRFIKNKTYVDNDPSFEAWLEKILVESEKNWKEMKKWEKSKNTCPQN